MPSKPVKAYVAVVGVQFADGDTEYRVEPGEPIPPRFTIPPEWVASGKVRVA